VHIFVRFAKSLSYFAGPTYLDIECPISWENSRGLGSFDFLGWTIDS